jgi:hypothetical protein
MNSDDELVGAKAAPEPNPTPTHINKPKVQMHVPEKDNIVPK